MPNPIKHKISLCTVCMNRLYHLRQTLPENILNNLNYSEIEFVVLNYNSSDDMEAWVQEEMSEYIQRGIVKYYRTPTPKSFDQSKSRNVLFRLATGDIICNIDADNYTGKGFAQYVNEVFAADSNCFIRGNTRLRYDLGGRICMWKEDFMRVNGYDEQMLSYGYEDDDLVNRLLNLGRKLVVIEEAAYQQVISHSHKERVQNDHSLNSLKGIYVDHQTYYRSAVLFLYNDHTLIHETITDNFTVNSLSPANINQISHHQYQYSLDDAGIRRGTWQASENNMRLSFDNGDKWSLLENGESRQLQVEGSETVYHLVQGENNILKIMFFQTKFMSLLKVKENVENSMAPINAAGFGKALVYQNFDTQSPIVLS